MEATKLSFEEKIEQFLTALDKSIAKSNAGCFSIIACIIILI